MYDHNDPNYKNSVFVDKGWQDVSKDFGEPVPECKKKWRHLRSSLSRYLKSSKDELKNKNNKLKPYYLLTHMNFLVPYTKTLDTKTDTVVCNKFEEQQYDEDMKTEEDPSSFEHEIIQDEDSANDEMEANIVYEAYEIQEPIPTSSATSQSQTKSQITLVRSSHSNNNQNTNVQQLPLSINQISGSPSKPQTQTLQLNSSQFAQIQQQTQQSQQTIPLQNTIIPIPDDQSSADLNFFLALLPDIKIMNQEQKRKLRIGTLRLIDDILSTN